MNSVRRTPSDFYNTRQHHTKYDVLNRLWRYVLVTAGRFWVEIGKALRTTTAASQCERKRNKCAVKNLMHVNNLMLALEKRKMRPLHDPIL